MIQYDKINPIVDTVKNTIQYFGILGKPVIAGGAIRDMSFNKTPKDYDVFFFMGRTVTDEQFFQIAKEIMGNIASSGCY